MKYDIITGNSFCEQIRLYYPSIDEAEDLHVSQIVNCVFNAFLSYNTVMLNIATIHAITKTSSLPKPLKTLLLSLAASDLGVGLLVQPLFITLLIQWLQQLSPSCIMYTSFSVAMNLFFTASFANIIGITLDRCLAIQLHLRYHNIVTHWRVIAVVIFIWLFSIFLSLRMFWLPSAIRYLILAVVGILSVLVTTLLYIKIYLVLRRHRNQIQALQVQQTAQNGERTANFANLRRSAVGTFYVYLLFLLCYLPRFVLLITLHIYGPNTHLKSFSLCSLTLIFLNSTLNPFIYCWKMRPVRNSLMNTLRSGSKSTFCLLFVRMCYYG